MNSILFLHLGFFNFGHTEMIIILVVAVLLFGGRLPEIARNFGKVFFEFKRNIRDLKDDIYREDYTPSRNLPKPYEQVTGTDTYSPPEPEEEEKTKGD